MFRRRAAHPADNANGPLRLIRRSKLGAWDDIEHADLKGLVGPRYGSIGVVLQKPT